MQCETDIHETHLANQMFGPAVDGGGIGARRHGRQGRGQ